MEVENQAGEQSLSSILSATYDKIQSEPETVTPEITEVADAATVTESQAETATADAAKEATAEPVAPIEPAKAIEAPTSWSAEAKAKFATLDPDVQKEILKREDDVTKGFEKYSDDRKYAQSLREAIQPYMAIIQAEGGTPATAVSALMNTAYILRTGTAQQKAQALQQIAKDYQIDLNHAQPQGEQDQYVDPLLAETRNELNSIKSELHEQKQKEAADLIKAFGEKPENKYFSNQAVRNEMGELLGMGKATSVEDAYAKAIKLVPEVFDQIMAEKVAEQRQAEEAKRIEEQKAAATAAKKAAGTVLTGKAGIVGADKPASLRESLEKKFDQIQAA